MGKEVEGWEREREGEGGERNLGAMVRLPALYVNRIRKRLVQLQRFTMIVSF